MDLNKEIKLSELFRRKPMGDGADTGTAAEPAPEKPPREKKARGGFFGFRRRDEEGADGAAPPEPKKRKREQQEKEPKESRRARKNRKADPLPQVPLMRAFNLLPKEELRRDAASGEEGGRRPSTVQLVLAVVGLVLVAALASIFLITNATVADKEAELNDLKGQLAALNVAAEKPAAPEADSALVQEQTNRTGALATALGRRVVWDRLLRELSLVLPENVWLTTLTAKTGGANVDPAAPAPDPNAPVAASTFELRGYTRKQEDVAQLLSRMSVLPQVATVKLVSSTATEIGGEDVVEFTISATLKPAGAGGTA